MIAHNPMDPNPDTGMPAIISRSKSWDKRTEKERDSWMIRLFP
jgi:hypothetical protein